MIPVVLSGCNWLSGHRSGVKIFHSTGVNQKSYTYLLCNQGENVSRLKLVLSLLVASALIGCSAHSVKPGAETVEIVIEQPDRNLCEFKGEIVGSQGNWFTGDFTSNESLMIGARNELLNQAYEMGANVVYMQDMKNTNAWGSLGTTNSTAIGKAYKCNY